MELDSRKMSRRDSTGCPKKKFIFQFLTTFVLEHLTLSFFQVLFYGNRSFIPEILKPLS